MVGINVDEQRDVHNPDYCFVYYHRLADIREHGNDAELGYYMASASNITRIRTDSRGNFGVIVEDYRLNDKGEREVSRRVWRIFDKTKREVFFKDITFLDNVWSLDSFNAVSGKEGHAEFGYFLLFGR